MRNLLQTTAIFLVVTLAIQVFPVTRDNPPVAGAVAAPPPVAATLRRACFNCHSNETVWPWYSRVAPTSWFVANDVHQGREHLNFSTWMSLTPAEQQKRLRKIADVVEKGAMPPGIYTPFHQEARLSLEDITTVAEWARASAK